MRTPFSTLVCIGLLASIGCQSARRTTGNVMRFVTVGLWNEIADDDVALQYDSVDAKWDIVDDDGPQFNENSN